MQLLALALYADDGRRRDVRFAPAQLNIVTGESKTGKSALLTITEFCLGRDQYLIPAGPIANHVAWYASLWQLTDDPDGPRAFVARPAPGRGRASTQRAMLEFGGAALDLLRRDQLVENADSDAVRRQLGRRIGIEENVVESRGPGMNQTPFEAHLGHAAWLCLQDQDEIANRFQIFHRQGDTRVAEHLKDTIPYFLGAVPADAASRRAALRDAQRALRRAEAALAEGRRAAENSDVELRGLLHEAYAAGLVGEQDLSDRDAILRLLREARHPDVPTADPPAAAGPVQDQDRRRDLRRRHDELRVELDVVMDDRALLLDRQSAERDFTRAVELHAGRLTSLDLLPDVRPEHASEPHPPSQLAACPLCGAASETLDPTVEQLTERLTSLRAELTTIDTAPESRQAVLTQLEAEAARLRTELAATGSALEALDVADELARSSRESAAARNYTRGRIDASLAALESGRESSVLALSRSLDVAAERVSRLAQGLDPDNEREQLLSRLNIVGRTMTDLARRLGLEHVENGVRLDLAALTIVTDTSDGPLPLSRIGSAANWIGYHLATHLALHTYFVENKRPVPRFLMLDQPTQAYYPSDAAKNVGQVGDADRAAVLTMFEVMRDVVQALTPRFQIIVSDHANLEEEWFQAAIRHEWRGGAKLVPSDWLS